MDYRLIYTNSAQKDLKRIDKGQALSILRKIDEYAKLANPLLKAKKLKGFDIDTYRFRIGDYRAIFRLDNKTGNIVILVVLKIAHRKEVYE